jgi:hypothetical protein
MIMPNPQFIDDLELDQDVSRRLAQSLQSTIEGSQDVLRTPFLNDFEPSEILARFDKVIEPHLDSLAPGLRDLELSNRDKALEPRSVAAPWKDRKESLVSYFRKTEATNDVGTYKGSDYRRLRPISLQNAVKLLKNNTSSGLPYLKKKGDIKERMLADFKNILARQDPCMLYARTQTRKTRNVWGYPAADTAEEMRWFAPLLRYHVANSEWRSSLRGPDAVDKRITHLFAKRGERKLISIDFDSYDASVKEQIQKRVFGYIKSLFQTQYSEEIDIIADRFLNIGIVTPEGVWIGPHGVPSGSTLTNEIDSDAQKEIASDVVDVNEYADINGDDGVYLLDKPDVLIEHFTSLGLKVNVGKTYLDKDYFIYLQNYFGEEYRIDGIIRGVYPLYRALHRLIFQEKWSNFEDYGISGIDFYSIRAKSILENARYHPLFSLMIKFVLENDKYGLATSENGLAKYVNMVSQTSGTQGIMLNQRGDDVRNMRNFSSFKMVNDMNSA